MKTEQTRSEQIRAWIATNGPTTNSAVSATFGITAKQARAALCDMAKRGILIASGNPGSRTYSAGRTPKRYARVIKTENTARDRRDAVRQIVTMRLDAIATAPASQPEAETVAEYVARGGVIERLPPGVWSTPLRVEL